MLKANYDHFYYRKYSCMTCVPCRTFKTDPFTDSVKCERESECGPWKKGYFRRKRAAKEEESSSEEEESEESSSWTRNLLTSC